MDGDNRWRQYNLSLLRVLEEENGANKVDTVIEEIDLFNFVFCLFVF